MKAFPGPDFDKNIPISQIKTGVSDSRIKCKLFTYFNQEPQFSFPLQDSRLEVGAFCSISNQLKLVFTQHRFDCISTYPFNDLLSSYIGRECLANDDKWSKGNIIIGNDVWVGADVTLLSGVTIGDGAVIGAGSVVAKDIPPYAVAVGNPVKIIKYRFNDEIIERLLRLQWWELTFNQITEILPILASAPNKQILDELIAKYR